MKWAAGFLLAVGLGVSGIAATRAQSNVQFSGRAIQSSPDGKSREAQLYVGDNQVRLEHSRGDEDIVEIYDMKNQRVLVLVPQQKVYMQRDLPAGAAGNPMLPPKDSTPCTGMPDAHCKKLATERLLGRPVAKWEVTIDRKDKQSHSLHWIDEKRHMSLRDVWPDGSVTESVLEGKESLDGRSVERWRRTTSFPDGKKETTTQWYDPELQIAIREELPGGYFREIRDIHVAPQPPTRFEVPAGYRQVAGDNPALRQGSTPPQPDNR